MDPQEMAGEDQENFLGEFERERWFTLFKAAHDFELTAEETTRLAEALKETYKATQKPLDTVRKHLQRIFREKLTQNDKQLLVKNYVEAWKTAKVRLEEIKSIVKDPIGAGMRTRSSTRPQRPWSRPTSGPSPQRPASRKWATS